MKPKYGKVGSVSLRASHPDLLAEWHPSNFLSPDDWSCGSNKKVTWVCKNNSDHIWNAPIVRRAMEFSGCPFCKRGRYKQVNETNCIVASHPELVASWHPDNTLKPTQVSAGCRKKIKWMCPHNHCWTCEVRERADGCGCPFCRRSKGEEEVESILKDLNITYRREFVFDSCKNILSLPFDFAIRLSNDRVGLIEFQGEQHFLYIPHFHKNIKGFESRLVKDQIKSLFCCEKNIPLLAIPYWEIETVRTRIVNFIVQHSNSTNQSLIMSGI